MAVEIILTHLPQNQFITWKLTTEERYMEMLCVLPPEYMNANGFLVGEPTDHREGQPRYAAFRHDGGGHYEATEPCTLAEFQYATEGKPLPKPEARVPRVPKKKSASGPCCVFCGTTTGQFAIFNPRFKPFGTACTNCEATLPAGTQVPTQPAEPQPA